MIIRHAKKEDLDDIMAIYEIARQTMRKNGNDKQWINGFPQRELIEQDIASGINYVFTEDSKVHGVFALIFGNDPTYSYIEDGKWLSDNPYCTIHRIASDGFFHGIVKAATDFALEKINSVRIDTHELNILMQHTVEKIGYKKCGTIYIEDGSPRIAYQYEKLV